MTLVPLPLLVDQAPIQLERFEERHGEATGQRRGLLDGCRAHRFRREEEVVNSDRSQIDGDDAVVSLRAEVQHVVPRRSSQRNSEQSGQEGWWR